VPTKSDLAVDLASNGSEVVSKAMVVHPSPARHGCCGKRAGLVLFLSPEALKSRAWSFSTLTSHLP